MLEEKIPKTHVYIYIFGSLKKKDLLRFINIIFKGCK
jgi:hypothetical protein